MIEDNEKNSEHEPEKAEEREPVPPVLQLLFQPNVPVWALINWLEEGPQP